MSKSTTGIKEALIEYLEHYVVKKKLTLREVESIEKLFEKHGKNDRIDKAIEWCDGQINTGSFETFSNVALYKTFKEMLQSLKK